MDWKHLLAYITGTVDQALLLRNEYLVTENRILRHQLTGRMRLTDGERTTLAAIGHKLGQQALKEASCILDFVKDPFDAFTDAVEQAFKAIRVLDFLVDTLGSGDARAGLVLHLGLPFFT